MPGEVSNNFRTLPSPEFVVAYMDLSGGLNTKLDTHALDRNMLASSINMWPAYNKSLAKRPGTTPAITTLGTTGLAGVGTTIVNTSWTVSGTDSSVLLVQNGIHLAYAAVGASAWTPITTAMGAGAKRIHVAQIYDPLTGAPVCFICNGVDQPWIWQGPGFNTLTQTSVANGLPVNQSGTIGITPRFCLVWNGTLLYAGEPTSPSAVYISNAWFPQAFTQSSTSLSTPYPGSYQPYLIGWDDGIAGGSITGLANLQGVVIVCKNAAIYRGQFVNTYGTAYAIAWQYVSSSRGFVAPESIVVFDTYICGLSFDGVYYCDGYSMQQISADVPTFFDGSLTGFPAICLVKNTAVGARFGTRYLIFYDRGIPTVPGVASGYPTSGLWFDFAKPTASGLPAVGEMQGTSNVTLANAWAVAGMATVAGPNDTGLVVWNDPTQDRVGFFGIGFADFTLAITASLAGKADMMPEVASPGEAGAAISSKHISRAYINIATPLGNPLQFSASILTDLQNATLISASTPSSSSSGLVWGTGSWGIGTWGGSANQTAYYALGFSPNQSADGLIIQFTLSESSTQEWLLLGYELEASARMPNL
jgi:hypothetical protein